MEIQLLDQRIDNMDKKLDEILEYIKGHEQRIENIEDVKNDNFVKLLELELTERHKKNQKQFISLIKEWWWICLLIYMALERMGILNKI